MFYISRLKKEGMLTHEGHNSHRPIFDGQPYRREVRMNPCGSRTQNESRWLDVIWREILASCKEEFCDPEMCPKKQNGLHWELSSEFSRVVLNCLLGLW